MRRVSHPRGHWGRRGPAVRRDPAATRRDDAAARSGPAAAPAQQSAPRPCGRGVGGALSAPALQPDLTVRSGSSALSAPLGGRRRGAGEALCCCSAAGPSRGGEGGGVGFGARRLHGSGARRARPLVRQWRRWEGWEGGGYGSAMCPPTRPGVVGRLCCAGRPGGMENKKSARENSADRILHQLFKVFE